MSDVVTMDDLSNEEIMSILEDSVRLVPVAKGEVHLPLLEGKVLAQEHIHKPREKHGHILWQLHVGRNILWLVWDPRVCPVAASLEKVS